jgi:uncharacterized repeat protein (TIGR04076 family)
MAKVRVTVIKKMSTKDVHGDNFPCQIAEDFSQECPRLNVGDEFVVPENGACPDGFCGWAFADIHPVITHLRFGGTFPFGKDGGVAIACCTDGLRPVFFKVERIEE